MNKPQQEMEKMNWADYWDSLTDEYFELLASAEIQSTVTEQRPKDRAIPSGEQRPAHEPA